MRNKPSRLILTFEPQELSEFIENQYAKKEISAAIAESAAATDTDGTFLTDEAVMRRLLAKVDRNVQYDPSESPVFKNYKSKLLDARQHTFK